VVLERAEQVNNPPVLARLRAELAEARARRAGAPAAVAATGLAAWHPAGIRTVLDLRDSTPAYWVAHQGHLAHLAGSATDLLLVDYPLTGTYEFSVDAYAGPWAESVLAHNGLAIEPFSLGGITRIAPLGESEAISIPWRLTRLNGFNRLTVQASPERVRYLVNGHLFYEDDDPSPTSPWLGLLSYRERHSVWRDPALRGRPLIPREVRLSHGDRLEGWISNFYSESQPARRTDRTGDSWGNEAYPSGNTRASGAMAGWKRARKPRGPVNPDDYDWSAKDGVIFGRRTLANTATVNYWDTESSGSVTEADQSRLWYHRPLRDGDVVMYEFLYEPGSMMVHPALDRLAFLLEPAGVQVHWMTAGGGDLSGLPADNAAEEPANRRGPRPIPLKPGQWNALRLSLGADRATIDLNGQTVYERPLEPTLGRQFGLFHYKDQTAAQVRNIVLRGRWPEAIPAREQAGLAAEDPSVPSDAASRRARHALIGEAFFALRACEIVEEARSLPPADRYRFLADWVLPAPDHPIFRLEGDSTPSFPAKVGGVGAGSRPVGQPDHGHDGRAGVPSPHGLGTRLQTGGDLRAPALELVDCARELGRLDELAARVEGGKPAVEEGSEDDRDAARRGQLALRALIDLARGDDAAVARGIEATRPLLDKLALDQPEWTSWPELALAERAVARPALRPRALAVIETLLERERKKTRTEAEKKAPSGLWEDRLKDLRARAIATAGAAGASAPARPLGDDPDVLPWARVTQTRAQSRGDGEPIARWTWRDGRLTHHSGHDRDMMDLTIPLRGDFQLDCELTAAPGREIRVAYAGLALGPKADGKHLERSALGRPMPDVAVNPPLEKLGEWSAYRLAVRGGRMTAFLNGRKVHEVPIPAECDPWLVFFCQAAQSGAARKITITGAPRVPETLKLSALPDLSGWLAEEYGDSVTGDQADWEKRGEEIVGRLNEDAPGSRQESVLRYHRPLLEDGRITYEFYYEPGKVLVHPALDRLAFLLEPDGVKVHWLTDGAHERTGLAPDNLHEEPENRRGLSSLPLKPRAWNSLALSLAGDRVTIELNDRVITERPLEPINQRSFGLFHYADATRARVRNVTYRGNWARSLPASLRQ
jgi:hypothetical protein